MFPKLLVVLVALAATASAAVSPIAIEVPSSLQDCQAYTFKWTGGEGTYTVHPSLPSAHPAEPAPFYVVIETAGETGAEGTQYLSEGDIQENQLTYVVDIPAGTSVIVAVTGKGNTDIAYSSPIAIGELFIFLPLEWTAESCSRGWTKLLHEQIDHARNTEGWAQKDDSILYVPVANAQTRIPKHMCETITESLYPRRPNDLFHAQRWMTLADFCKIGAQVPSSSDSWLAATLFFGLRAYRLWGRKRPVAVPIIMTMHVSLVSGLVLDIYALTQPSFDASSGSVELMVFERWVENLLKWRTKLQKVWIFSTLVSDLLICGLIVVALLRFKSVYSMTHSVINKVIIMLTETMLPPVILVLLYSIALFTGHGPGSWFRNCGPLQSVAYWFAIVWSLSRRENFQAALGGDSGTPPLHLSSRMAHALGLSDSAVDVNLFRITGKAYTLSKAKIADAKALEELDVGEDAKYWEDKRMELWEGAMSGHLRASFARPTPGTPLDKVDRQPDEWTESLPVKPEGKDDKVDKEVEAALEHFALVAIKAENVEFLELKCTPNRRTAWNKQTDGSWKKVSVVP
ncbi:hypothetical protein P7C73_g3612, partial [Tremellales sp. Uapishka_1]